MPPAKNMSPFSRLDEDAALRRILSGTATKTGTDFFDALVQNLARALNTQIAWISEYLEDINSLRTLAFLVNGDLLPSYQYEIMGTPCEPVIHGARLTHHPSKIQAHYPMDVELKELGAESYLGVPLTDVDGTILGNMAVMDTQPMPEEPHGLAIFQIFAARACAELQRLRAEKDVHDREIKLSRLVDSTMDVIVELDLNLNISLMNTSAEKAFGVSQEETVGHKFHDFLTKASANKLSELTGKLDNPDNGFKHLWVAGGLEAFGKDATIFPAEASLSRFETQKKPHYTLVMRNVNDRLQAEKQIQSLSNEAEYLKEEIRSLTKFGEIVGTSQGLLEVLKDVERVATTEASVLILGETGTGKELFARAVHGASLRKDKPLIKVDCANLPANLIESELFGHEKGAFTGATQKRVGRFTLADKGTIFLDEIGELPLDLQSKLLRVLQEGEFEPVGSSQTKKVNVRVIAATNRDLFQAAGQHEFREDLYYRLAVFPLEIPPLRKRQEDIPLLANEFVKRYNQKLGRPANPLRTQDVARLKQYHWPGNVRELQNVVERALITSKDGFLDLDRALPETAPTTGGKNANPVVTTEKIRTAAELQNLERDNIQAAMKAANWKVSGEHGAAKLLDMKPTTLSSRIKALGIIRPSTEH